MSELADEAVLALRAAMDGARARLVALQRDMVGIVAAAQGATDDEHDPEGTTAFDRAQVQSLLDANAEQLHELAAALDRVRAGDYGSCEVCGEVIDPARLAARPAARTCVRCAGRR